MSDQAFPTPTVYHPFDKSIWSSAEPGLTKLEYFAGQAMQGILSNEALMEFASKISLDHDSVKQRVAYTSASYAQALIAELAKAEGKAQ